MKKTLALLITLIMAFACFSTFASAEKAPSPEGKSVVSSVIANDSENKYVKIVIKELEVIQNQADVDALIKAKFNQLSTEFKDENPQTDKTLVMIDKREVVVEGDVGLVVWPVTLTFQVPGVTPNSVGYFLHYLDDQGTVEVIDAVMGNGTMTGVFNSLSPVAFVVDTDTAKAVVSLMNSSDAKSPKTSTDVVTPIALSLVCVAAFVVSVSAKKFSATNR